MRRVPTTALDREPVGAKGVLAALLLLFGGLLPNLQGSSAAQAQTATAQREFEKPSKHFSVERPADLSDQAAFSIYLRILEEMTAGYRLSEDPSATEYRTWRRYNKTPYRSATHGARFVNNYANTMARPYGQFEAAGQMPVGSVLAKDTFAVTASGEVFLGPLFLMEKMPKGFNATSRDWRYCMIMPDGSLFGKTGGAGSARVEFCITCHKVAGDDHDHLFFVPEEQRVAR